MARGGRSFRAPRDIYGINIFRIVLHELGGPKVVSKFLRVSERTVFRWLKTENPPRAAVLALFWESRYGREIVENDQVNEIRMLYRHVCLYRDQCQRLKDIVTGIRALHAGTANEPLFEELPIVYPPPRDTYGSLVADASPSSSDGGVSAQARAAFKAFDTARQATA